MQLRFPKRDDAELAHHLDAGTTFEDFFAAARLNPNAELITGVVCDVRVEEVPDEVIARLPGNEEPKESGEPLRLAEAVRSAVGDRIAVTAKLNMRDGYRGGFDLDLLAELVTDGEVEVVGVGDDRRAVHHRLDNLSPGGRAQL